MAKCEECGARVQHKDRTRNGLFGFVCNECKSRVAAEKRAAKAEGNATASSSTSRGGQEFWAKQRAAEAAERVKERKAEAKRLEQLGVAAPATAAEPAVVAPAPVSAPAPAPPTIVPPPPGTPAGWMPDPTTRFEQRYWDGGKWTEHVFRGGEQAVDLV